MKDSLPPIDLVAPQFLRCFMDAPAPKGGRAAWPRQQDAGTLAPEAVVIREIGRPYESYCLVLDTETTTDTRQALRFGSYAIFGVESDGRIALCRRGQLTREVLDRCEERGFFYDPVELTPDEIATLVKYAKSRRMKLWTRDDFVKSVFYPWVYWKQALCIGHNLPFDLSRLAVTWGPAIEWFLGGFWLSLCGCVHGAKCFAHPPIRIKTLGSKRASFEFRAVKPPHGKPKSYRGKFLDTATFGLALLGPGDPSLEGMGRRFRARTLKKPWPGEHDAVLTPSYLDYACHDVEATWALYQSERELFRRHHVSTPPWKIYSEASLGKAYLRDMAVPPFMAQHADFPKSVLGYFMQTYYGGRAEVRLRLQPTEVLVTDFKSQYPTVNALMDLQALLLAEHIEVKHCAEETRTFLNALTLDQLQDRNTMKRLRCIVQIPPAADILPVRTHYTKTSTALNIGVNVVTSPIPVWVALADVMASKLLTGKTPEILDAIELVPHRRVPTTPKRLFDDPRYQIDLNVDDLFARVIDLRSDITQQSPI